MLCAASRVWVISDPMADELRSRYGVDASVLPHCVDVQRYRGVTCPARSDRNPFRLLYTGSIYGAQAGAIRNVLSAIQSQTDDWASLTIFTGQSSEELDRQGISGPRLFVERAVAPEAIPGVLSMADGLLLPFSFDEQERVVVSTSLPTKLADYLASGIPILLHAPPYSSITRLARAEGWAEIVDEPNTESICTALHRLATDEALRIRLAGRALDTAQRRHDLISRRVEVLTSIRQVVAVR
jgi:glycosyltransferase involved in cell wall biosynthesis